MACSRCAARREALRRLADHVVAGIIAVRSPAEPVKPIQPTAKRPSRHVEVRR